MDRSRSPPITKEQEQALKDDPPDYPEGWDEPGAVKVKSTKEVKDTRPTKRRRMTQSQVVEPSSTVLRGDAVGGTAEHRPDRRPSASSGLPEVVLDYVGAGGTHVKMC